MTLNSNEVALIVYQELARRGIEVTGKYTFHVELQESSPAIVKITDFNIELEMETKATLEKPK